MSAEDFTLGIVEGFYGRQWSWAQRRELVGKLPAWGYRDYVYAPKGDTQLRSHWRAPFPAAWREAVMAWAKCCQAAGIRWGLGLSPAGAQAKFTDADRQALESKLAEIAQLNPDILWVLFDDLPAGNPNLATNQVAVVESVRKQLPAVKLAVCPSYYSDDPILEEVFGARPVGYFEDLAAGLPKDVEILWTGPKVISDSYSEDDMRRAERQLGRKPLLWDNYPVNDGRKTSRFLHLQPFVGRPAGLAKWTVGHYVNPMNQFHLSELVLSGLANVYREGGNYSAQRQFDLALAELPQVLASLLRRDAQVFQSQGLDALTDNDKSTLIHDYATIDHPVAEEVRAWLNEEYRFDPACLTE